MSCCKKCCGGEKKDGMKDINRDRSCTDLLMGLVFVAFLVLMAVFAILGAAQGNAASLFFATDWSGNTCGSENLNVADASKRKDRTKQQYAVYPRLSEDMLNQIPFDDPLALTFFAICVDKCPARGDWVCTDAVADYATAPVQTKLDACKNSVGGGQFLSLRDYPSGHQDCPSLMAQCWQIPTQSVNFLFRCMYDYNFTTTQTQERICVDPPGVPAASENCTLTGEAVTVYQEKSAQEDVMMQRMSSFTAVVTRYIADVSTAWPTIVLIGGLGAAVFGFVWLGLLRYCAGCFVWFAIWLFLLILVVLTLYAFMKAGILNASDVANAVAADADLDASLNAAATSSDLTGLGTAGTDEEVEMFTWIAYALAIITVVYIVIIIFMRKSIKTAVAVIKEATKAVAHMPLIMAFPLSTLVAVLAMFGFWAWTFGNIYTMGSVTLGDVVNTASDTVGANADNYTVVSGTYESSPAKDYILAFLVFALYWMNAFIQGVATLAICGAFAGWYWTEVDGETGKKAYKDKFPVGAALWRAVRYHLGSVAFGSLIIALCQFARTVLEYLDKKSKGAQDGNCAVKVLFKVLRCCLWCFEKCVRYITRKAYIVIAVKGTNFCSAAVTVFHLILSNGGLLSLVAVISNAMMLLGKLLIVACCVGVGYAVYDAELIVVGEGKALTGLVFPLVLIGLLAWFMASGFLQVYDMGIDTILVSYLFDLQENKEGQYMFSESLAKVVGKGGQTRGAAAQAAAANETSAKYVAEPDAKEEDDGGPVTTQASAGDFI